MTENTQPDTALDPTTTSAEGTSSAIAATTAEAEPSSDCLLYTSDAADD